MKHLLQQYVTLVRRYPIDQRSGNYLAVGAKVESQFQNLNLKWKLRELKNLLAKTMMLKVEIRSKILVTCTISHIPCSNQTK